MRNNKPPAMRKSINLRDLSTCSQAPFSIVKYRQGVPMKATYRKRFQKLFYMLKNTDLVELARMDEHNTFSRK